LELNRLIAGDILVGSGKARARDALRQLRRTGVT
jgi:hypothetical protein